MSVIGQIVAVLVALAVMLVCVGLAVVVSADERRQTRHWRHRWRRTGINVGPEHLWTCGICGVDRTSGHPDGPSTWCCPGPPREREP